MGQKSVFFFKKYTTFANYIKVQPYSTKITLLPTQLIIIPTDSFYMVTYLYRNYTYLHLLSPNGNHWRKHPPRCLVVPLRCCRRFDNRRFRIGMLWSCLHLVRQFLDCMNGCYALYRCDIIMMD